MPTGVSSQDIATDLQATLAARHEVGAAYDDHFVAALVDKLKEQVLLDLRPETRPARVKATASAVDGLTPEQRALVALVSMCVILAILIYALAFSYTVSDQRGTAFLVGTMATLIVLLNIALNIRVNLKQR